MSSTLFHLTAYELPSSETSPVPTLKFIAYEPQTQMQVRVCQTSCFLCLREQTISVFVLGPCNRLASWQRCLLPTVQQVQAMLTSSHTPPPSRRSIVLLCTRRHIQLVAVIESAAVLEAAGGQHSPWIAAENRERLAGIVGGALRLKVKLLMSPLEAH